MQIQALVASLLVAGALALGLGSVGSPDAIPSQGDSCGDYRCQPPEDCRSCPHDCGDCCGDRRCAPPEDCRSCPQDCGDC